MQIISESLSDQVYNLLKGEILKGTIKGGDRISEENIASKLGVSRTPIREALKRLAEYGLISLSPRSHASVITISEEEAEDIAALRCNLEFFAIDNIKPSILNEKLEVISRYAADCQYQISIGERDKAFELDSLFHIALVDTAGNKALSSIYRVLDAKTQLLRVKQNLPEEELMPYLIQHTTLISLLKAGKRVEAKKLIQEHITHENAS